VPPDLRAPGEAFETLTHNRSNAATGGIWRARGGSGPRVLKIAQPGTDDPTLVWGTSDDQAHWNYWQREPLAYRGGLVASAYADAGLRGPRLLDAVDRPDGSVALWLEEVSGEPGATWTPSELRAFCERLGAAQGAWASGRCRTRGCLNTGCGSMRRGDRSARPPTGMRRSWPRRGRRTFGPDSHGWRQTGTPFSRSRTDARARWRTSTLS
jgi:hypothetical protein